MTPLRQALSEADEALTGTLLARMQDVEAARATVGNYRHESRNRVSIPASG